jgi:hypothetical protein
MTPKPYTKIWSGFRELEFESDWQITEMICEDNVSFTDLKSHYNWSPSQIVTAGTNGLATRRVLTRHLTVRDVSLRNAECRDSGIW